MTVASALRGILDSRGMTRADLHERCGVGLSTIDKWLAGRAQPSPESLERLCDGLGVSPADLGMPDGAQRVQPGGSVARMRSQREEIVRRHREGQTANRIAQDMRVPGSTVSLVIRQSEARPRPVEAAPKDSVAEWLRPVLAAPSQSWVRCPICGAPGPLERHHVVRRSQGGSKGPTVTLCHECHMAVHAQRLHVWWVARASTAFGLAYGMGGGHYVWLRARGSTFDLVNDPKREGEWKPFRSRWGDR